MEEMNKDCAVIDASFMFCYLFPDERIQEVQDVFDQYKSGKLQLISTEFFPFEVMNGIFAGVLSKRLEEALAMDLIRDFLSLPIQLEYINNIQAYTLAVKHKISVYDASYLTLAREKGISLFSLDKKFQQAI